jgi:hypothetical protein
MPRIALAAALVFAACSDEGSTPPFAGGGEATHRAQYPEGPYGLGDGSILRERVGLGFRTGGAHGGELASIRLSDFYNPSEDASRPLALVIAQSVAWSGPDNQLAEELVDVRAEAAPCGGEVLTVLREGNTLGDAASPEDLSTYISTRTITWPVLIDPAGDFTDLMRVVAFPSVQVVDTRTMTLVSSSAGLPVSWEAYDALLDPTCP